MYSIFTHNMNNTTGNTNRNEGDLELVNKNRREMATKRGKRGDKISAKDSKR